MTAVAHLFAKIRVLRQLDAIKKKQFKCLVKCYSPMRGFDEDGGGGSILIVNTKHTATSEDPAL